MFGQGGVCDQIEVGWLCVRNEVDVGWLCVWCVGSSVCTLVGVGWLCVLGWVPAYE